jgi:hypothetical protein
VGGGSATGALDRGWEAAEAADDGEQELRRSSGDAWHSERREAVEMQVREGKGEFVGSSGMFFKFRRHSERKLLLASSAARVAAWAVVARRGGARRGPSEAGKRWARVQERHVARGKAVRGRRSSGKQPARAAWSGAEKTERGRSWRLKTGTCNSPKMQGLQCKARLTFKP